MLPMWLIRVLEIVMEFNVDDVAHVAHVVDKGVGNCNGV